MRLKSWLFLILLLLVAFYIVLFCLNNTLSVNIDFFFVKITAVSLDIALLAAFVVGGILGVLSSLGMLVTMRKKYRKALFQAKQSQ